MYMRDHFFIPRANILILIVTYALYLNPIISIPKNIG